MGAQTSKYHTLEFDNDSFYVGELDENNEMSGEGKFVDEFGNTYIGYFSKGKFNGYGEMDYTNKEFLTEKTYYPKTYQGNWKDNCKHGSGLLTFSDGSKYEGNFHLDNIHGKGTLTFANNNYFIGNFHNGKAKGYGTMYNSKGKIIYQGNWVEDLYDGFGKLYITNNLKYKGNFNQGYYHGIGTVYFDNGNKNIKAEFNFGVVTKIINQYHNLKLPSDIYTTSISEFQDNQFSGKIQSLSKSNPISNFSNKLFISPSKTPDPSAPPAEYPKPISNKVHFPPSKVSSPKSTQNTHTRINPLNIFI